MTHLFARLLTCWCLLLRFGGCGGTALDLRTSSAVQVNQVLRTLYARGDMVQLKEIALQVVQENNSEVLQDLSFPSVFQYLGVAQYSLGDLEEATRTFEQAVKVNENDAESWVHLGTCYLYDKRLPEAVTALEVGVKQKGSVKNMHALLKARNWMANWEDRDDSLAQVQKTMEGALRMGHLPDVNAFDVAELPPRTLVELRRRAYEESYAITERLCCDERTDLRLKAPELRIGFVSSDFAKIIQSHEIHVLMDLNGHTLHSGINIFTHRPAPVQVAYLGNWQKMDPSVFSAWMEILARVPSGVMWFIEYFGHEGAIANLRAEAEAHGIDSNRLIFSQLDPWIDHTYRKRAADLILDTSLKNGHTTILDALFAGVPVVTLEGDRMSNRATSSALNSLGLHDLTVNSLKEYVEVAVYLATHRQVLRKLREKVEENRLRYPLFDTAKYTTKFEESIKAAWQVKKSGLQAGGLTREMHIFPSISSSSVAPRNLPVLSAKDDENTEDEYAVRIQRALAAGEPIRLHIGGHAKDPDWWIVDANDGDIVDFVMNMANLYAFPDNSVDAIYGSHVLEHCTHGVGHELEQTLREWHRVLRPGGQLFVSVPNLFVLATLFINESIPHQHRMWFMTVIFGGQIDVYDVHKVGFDEAILLAYLEQAGFCDFTGHDDFGFFQDSSVLIVYDTPISLNVQAHACKPQRSSLNGSPRHMTVEEMNQLSIRSLEELNQLSQATREFGEVYSGSPDASRRSPKFLQRLFDPLESKSDAECLFRVRISGIQCRNLQGRRFSGKSDPFVEFFWDDPEENAPYATPVIKADLNPNYKGVLIAIEYKAPLNALTKRYLSVKVFSNRKFHAKSLIGHTKVDLWSIATGPVHHDHHLVGCDNGRVVFNCYMEQCSEWNISVSDVGVMMPAIANELDRPEGHDFQEDASLPLKKFGVSYKCTIGTNEKFYMGNKLKHAIKREIGDIHEVSFQSLARLAVLSSRVSRPNTQPKGETGAEDEVAADSLVAQDPMGVEWATSSDYLPPITRYSTFDELMSATLTLEVRQLLVGRGQMSTDPDGGFLSLLEKYKKDTLATPNTDVQFDEEITNTILFGQTWLSLEKIFEDALQERMKKKYDADPTHGMNGLGFSEQFVTSKFEQSLTLKGHQVGVIYGTILFKRIPDVRQLRCGVNSENGISSSSSVIVGTVAAGSKKNLRKSKVVIPVEAQRVLEKMQDLVELMANRQKDDKEVKRAELSDLPLLGFDSTVATTVLGTKHTHKVSKKDLEFGLKLRAMLVETKFCVLQTVSVRGVMNNNLMFFVARMLSVLCFRLPSFGVELYQLWSESYNEPVPELAAEFRMNADADLFAMDGLEAHLDWRRFHKAIFDEYGEKALRNQEEEAEDKYEVTSEAWKSRFRRLNGEANTLNILLVDQWLWYVLDTLAVLNQKIGWVHLPGYTQVLMVFFLELKTQKSGWLPPTLYKLSCTMLSNSSLINPMTKFLLSSTSVHDVTAVIGAVELLGVWMYMIRSWRVRLSSYRLSHLENNDRWNFHQDDQYSIPAGDEVSLLPPSFDFRFLCAALRILLDSEHTQVVLTTLEFLYNCWDCFPERHADKLRFELLRSFIRLFLHWHREVRSFFQTLIAFRAMKSHGWTQKGASFVNTPPHSRRQIDAVAADFNSSLGTEEHSDSGRRSRSYSASNLMDSVHKRLSSSSPRSSPRSSPSPSPRNSGSSLSLTISSPNNRGFGSGHSTPTSDYKSGDSFQLDRTKTRSISEDYVKHPIPVQPKMDTSIQMKFQRLLESIYNAAKKYIDRQSENGHLLRKQTMKATWKKKGMLLKQGFIYKNTWKNKYLSLQNNKLGYADTEHGPIKREINVIGSVVSEMSNQLDHSQGTRVVLFNCFSVDSGYQKFVLCAPTFEEQREWIEVLTQNATAETAERKDNETLSQLDLAEVSGQLESLAGKHSSADEVPENLLPYSVLAVKEWLNFRVTALEIEGKIAVGQPFQMPVLLSKSSLYADDD
uniref:protein O-GlcNAc transferase n=1 Tax=Phytophthora ramorum TaxID=164328 RepID=H3HDK8_PHYRM